MDRRKVYFHKFESEKEILEEKKKHVEPKGND